MAKLLAPTFRILVIVGMMSLASDSYASSAYMPGDEQTPTGSSEPPTNTGDPLPPTGPTTPTTTEYDPEVYNKWFVNAPPVKSYTANCPGCGAIAPENSDPHAAYTTSYTQPVAKTYVQNCPGCAAIAPGASDPNAVYKAKYVPGTPKTYAEQCPFCVPKPAPAAE